jgi:asparagine synthase (glutamine-hydrolysing)
MMHREVTSRWEMLTGLSIAYPYLDDDYARFVGRIPSEALFAGARERGLLRESMEGLVPDSVRYRMDKSLGHEVLAQVFDAVGGGHAVSELLTMRELATLGIVDPSRFRAAFEAFAQDPGKHLSSQMALWSAITAEGYVRWFNNFRSGNLSCANSSSPEVAAP